MAAINDKLAASYHRLLSSNRLMPASGQPADVVTIGSGPPDHPSDREKLFVWTGSRRLTLAIVFTDIVGSTALGVELGDAAMGDMRLRHFDCARRLIANHEGKLVKTMGDGVIAVFRTVDAGLEFACALQAEPGAERLRVRAGVHIGAVDVTADDILGIEVAFASRVVGAIADAEIWLSDRAKEDLARAGTHRDKDGRWEPQREELKGLGEQRLWRLAMADGAPVADANVDWWNVGQIAEWVRARAPGAKGEQICPMLEQLCRKGEIRARGRRRIYSTDRALRIGFHTPEFLWFADQHGPLQPWSEPITADEWADLAVFIRPAPANGEQHHDATIRALDELQGDAELRSKSRYRLEWAEPEFSADDVKRAWPA